MRVLPKVTAALLAGAAMLAVSTAQAQQAPAGEVDALRAQVQALLARIEKLEKAPAAPAAPAAATAAAIASPTVKVPAPLPGQKEQELVTSGSFPGSWRLPGTDLSVRLYGFAKLDLSYDFRGVGPEDVFVASALPLLCYSTDLMS